MAEEQPRQAIIDREHVKVLSIAYLISGCLNWLFSLFGLFYAMFGFLIMTAIANAPTSLREGPPPRFMAWFIAVIGCSIFVVMIVFGVLQYMVYRRLNRHRARAFCLVVGGLSCIWIPYGTILGVFTFLVLLRSSVVRLFQVSGPPEAPITRADGVG